MTDTCLSRNGPGLHRHRNDDPEALDLAIDACEKQIRLGPEAAKVFLAEDTEDYLPAHHGFQQLAIIREREKDYAEAIRLCKEAMAQGWGVKGAGKVYQGGGAKLYH